MDKVSGRQSRVPIKDIEIVVDTTKLRYRTANNVDNLITHGNQYKLLCSSAGPFTDPFHSSPSMIKAALAQSSLEIDTEQKYKTGQESSHLYSIQIPCSFSAYTSIPGP
jgi:hypothetical protein